MLFHVGAQKLSSKGSLNKIKHVLDKTLKGIRGVRLDNRKVFSYTRY